MFFFFPVLCCSRSVDLPPKRPTFIPAIIKQKPNGANYFHGCLCPLDPNVLALWHLVLTRTWQLSSQCRWIDYHFHYHSSVHCTLGYPLAWWDPTQWETCYFPNASQFFAFLGWKHLHCLGLGRLWNVFRNLDDVL